MKSIRPGFPNGFCAQSVSDSWGISSNSPPEIARFVRGHPEAARKLLTESGNKRFAPSTFFNGSSIGYSVGWFSIEFGSECVQSFTDLADAATDYLLFSIGKTRWNPNEPNAASATVAEPALEYDDTEGQDS